MTRDIFKEQYFRCEHCQEKFPMANPFMANNVLRCLIKGHKIIFVHGDKIYSMEPKE